MLKSYDDKIIGYEHGALHGVASTKMSYIDRVKRNFNTLTREFSNIPVWQLFIPGIAVVALFHHHARSVSASILMASAVSFVLYNVVLAWAIL